METRRIGILRRNNALKIIINLKKESKYKWKTIRQKNIIGE